MASQVNLMGLSYYFIGCATAITLALFGFLPFRRSISKLIKWVFQRKGQSGFSKWSTAEEVTRGTDGTGLTAIVTGGASGIGRETTRALALRGVHVIIADINIDGGRKVKKAILEENPNAKIDVKKLDLGSLASVRDFASEFKSLGLPLNILINNAGVLALPSMLSPDKIDLQFQINYLGHFLLTNLLLETMKNTARQSHKEGRIVNVSSAGHKLAFHGIQLDGIKSIHDGSWYNRIYGYFQSKLAVTLCTKELAKRLKEEGAEVTVNSVHPGAAITNIGHYCGPLAGHFPNGYVHSLDCNFQSKKVNGVLSLMTDTFDYDPGAAISSIGQYFVKNASQGAATTCYVAMHPQVTGISGEYFSHCNIANPSSRAKDAKMAKKLWDLSLSLTDGK